MENCAPVKEELVLPSGCHLVKINVSKRLLDRLIFDSSNSALSTRKRSDFLSTPINDNEYQNNDDDKFDEILTYETNKQSVSRDGRDSQNSFDDDLVMDVLPDTTRFTTMISVNKINLDMLDQDDRLNINDEFDDVESVQQMEKITMYVQKNSRVKLVLLSLDSASSKEIYQIDNLIRNVIKNLFLIFFINNKKIKNQLTEIKK